MRIILARSALKHGISAGQIAYVIEHCGLAFDIPCRDELGNVQDAVLFLGDDGRAVAVEVIAIEQPDGGLLVIHAMKLRRPYRKRYAEAMAWRKVP